MPDIFTLDKRTKIMRSVKNKNTLPELIVQSLLRDIGIEYEREKKLLNCRPDIIITDIKRVVFIHGCFWHGHDCKRGRLPETNKSFWENKITKNKNRDLRNYTELNNAGWDFLVIWGCEIKNKNRDLKNYAELNNAGWDFLVIWGCEIKKRNLDTLIKIISRFVLLGSMRDE